jgi:AraC-like DNA-binding protein
VATSATSLFDIAIRSYGQEHAPDRHPFAQLVLPIAGEVRLDVGPQGGRLDPLHCAFVPVGAWHTQSSRVFNRSLILDIDETALGHAVWERLHDKPFAAITPAARKLIEFMELVSGQNAVRTAHLEGWVPLLLDTLALGAPQARSRLAALLAQVEADPGSPWSTESMAQCARISVSRLHAWFREELDTSPHAWLLRKRLDLACRYLASSKRSIADVAQAAGFSDQSALTRAMRQGLDVTPAAYRRAVRENVSISQ